MPWKLDHEVGISVLTQKTANAASSRREARVLTMCARRYGTIKAGRDLVSDRRLERVNGTRAVGSQSHPSVGGKERCLPCPQDGRGFLPSTVSSVN